MEIQKPPVRNGLSAKFWTESRSRFKRWFNPPRRLRFTRFGVYVVLLTLGVGFGAMNTGNNLAYLVFGMMLGFITASGVISEISLRGLEIEWIFSPDIFAGSPAPFRLAVKNRKKSLPSIGLRVITPFGPGRALYVAPGGHAALDFTFTPPKRGIHEISRIKIETLFPFGFFRKWRVFDEAQSFIVYPKINLGLKFDLRQPAGEKNRTTQEKGWGDTFWQIRDFQHGDNPRQISWKVSARQARLMVRETERETDKKISLTLGPRGPWNALSSEELEDAVSFVASLAWQKLAEGFAVGMHADDFSLAPSTNRRKVASILHYLALFDPSLPLEATPAPGLPDALPVLEIWKSR